MAGPQMYIAISSLRDLEKAWLMSMEGAGREQEKPVLWGASFLRTRKGRKEGNMKRGPVRSLEGPLQQLLCKPLPAPTEREQEGGAG